MIYGSVVFKLKQENFTKKLTQSWLRHIWYNFKFDENWFKTFYGSSIAGVTVTYDTNKNILNEEIKQDTIKELQAICCYAPVSQQIFIPKHDKTMLIFDIQTKKLNIFETKIGHGYK